MNNKIENTLFQCREINKEFGNVKANDDISINIRNSQIHALLGENGAGKSTLVKIIYGLLQPDSGSMTFSNTQFSPKSPKDARYIHSGKNIQTKREAKYQNQGREVERS